MKRSYTAIRFIVVLMMVAAFVACASTPKQSSTGEYIDDSVITTKVKALFVEDKAVSALNINVETFKGTVQLSGFVKYQADMNKAAEIARTINGVKSVKNDILIRP